MIPPRSEAHATRNEQTRTTFTSLEQASFLPPTSATISAQATRANVPHKVEDVPESNGAKIHWLGDSNAKSVLLYFHGKRQLYQQTAISNYDRWWLCAPPC